MSAGKACYGPAIDLAVFPAMPGYDSWSSSPYAGYAGYAGSAPYVDSLDGREFNSSSFVSNAFGVRLVRGGQALPFDRIGVWCPSTRKFLLDSNGNNTWDGRTGGDTLTAPSAC